MPPRATKPPRRCTPSISVEYTKISQRGTGLGIPGTSSQRSLNDM